jgi:hypothetical protein
VIGWNSQPAEISQPHGASKTRQLSTSSFGSKAIEMSADGEDNSITSHDENDHQVGNFIHKEIVD